MIEERLDATMSELDIDRYCAQRSLRIVRLIPGKRSEREGINRPHVLLAVPA